MPKKRRIIATIAMATAITAGVNYLASSDVGVSGMANPDITEANKDQTICNPNWSTKSIRPPVSYTNPLKNKLCREQNCGDVSKYELDHAIALTDGGHPTNPNNLWLQPYARPGAHEKDQLEVAIHKQICGGELTLAEGQNRLLHWKKWYKVKNNLGGAVEYDQDDD